MRLRLREWGFFLGLVFFPFDVKTTQTLKVWIFLLFCLRGCLLGVVDVVSSCGFTCGSRALVVQICVWLDGRISVELGTHFFVLSRCATYFRFWCCFCYTSDDLDLDAVLLNCCIFFSLFFLKLRIIDVKFATSLASKQRTRRAISGRYCSRRVCEYCNGEYCSQLQCIFLVVIKLVFSESK